LLFNSKVESRHERAYIVDLPLFVGWIGVGASRIRPCICLDYTFLAQDPADQMGFVRFILSCWPSHAFWPNTAYVTARFNHGSIFANQASSLEL
jgi:hypothetical protein